MLRATSALVPRDVLEGRRDEQWGEKPQLGVRLEPRGAAALAPGCCPAPAHLLLFEGLCQLWRGFFKAVQSVRVAGFCC